GGGDPLSGFRRGRRDPRPYLSRQSGCCRRDAAGAGGRAMSAALAIAACSATVEAARLAVAEGALLDLAGFGETIAGLCAEIAEAPSTERPALAAALRQLDRAI